MRFLGIGFSESDWNNIQTCFEKKLAHISLQYTLLNRNDLQPHKIIATCERVARWSPALVLFHPQGFRQFEDYLFFLSQFSMRCTSFPRIALVFDDIDRDLGPLFTCHPEIRIGNRMSFNLSGPSVFTQKSYLRFPKYRINSEVLGIYYQESPGVTSRKLLAELPSHTMFPISQVNQIEDAAGITATSTWIEAFLEQQKNPLPAEAIRGILKEDSECFLFPGFPVEWLDLISLGDIRIHHLLHLRHFCGNPGLKKIIQYLQTPQEIPSNVFCPVRLMGNIPVINQFLSLLFQQDGYQDVKSLTSLQGGEYTLEHKFLWVQLMEFPQMVFQGYRLRWEHEMEQILAPLKPHIEIESLTWYTPRAESPISRLELEHQLNGLQKREKQLEQEHRDAHRRNLIYSQEIAILTEVIQIVKKLTTLLAKALISDDILRDRVDTHFTQVLLLCEYQEQASELMLKLPHIPKKLWINPQDYQDAEDLKKLNILQLEQFSKSGAIIITNDGLQHLETLCKNALSRYEQVGIDGDQLEQQDQQTGADLKAIQQQKKDLALQWLYVSVKQLFIRDRDLFLPPTPPKKRQ
ncbi:MAG: hypothetical protein HQM11_20240 [SAR324 cluster bacterium]|nr:hypothetical protein [SAR324 cluster bacterium]